MTSRAITCRPNRVDRLPDDVSQCAAEIDGIDRRIIDLLLLRFEYSRHIGALKAKLGAEPFDSNRVRSQKAFFVENCVKGGLDEAMAASLIDTILQRVLSERLAPSAVQDCD